jgi:ATP-dependent DNA ligase
VPLASVSSTTRRKAVRSGGDSGREISASQSESFGLSILLQHNGRVVGLIERCLPSPAKTPPSGADWPHKIKHDGFRVPALRAADGVGLYTRNGNNFTKRFPLVVAAIAAPPVEW